MITEPDVTLTDYGLAIEGAVFTYLLCRRRDLQHPLRFWFMLFFGLAGVAAITGRTTHGFFLIPSTSTIMPSITSSRRWPSS